MRKKLVAANWKMNMTIGEAESFIEDFRMEVGEIQNVEIVIAPPFTSIPKVSELLGGSQKIRLGAQNMHFEMSGAYTGEISAPMLRELFVRYVIIGHSERRQLFGDTNAIVCKKFHTALKAELRPILCVGETLEQRDAGKEEQVLREQLIESIGEVDEDAFEDVVIAYEPVWAIGTGRNATPEQAQNAHASIRKTLAEIVSPAAADKTRILYGGSVKSSNARELMAEPDIDGALVGGASLEERSFLDIVKAASGEIEE
ncbi:MAG: triose-phosphate isomerase [Chthoniobacterales bacterium]